MIKTKQLGADHRQVPFGPEGVIPERVKVIQVFSVVRAGMARFHFATQTEFRQAAGGKNWMAWLCQCRGL
ncbi:hypothetical protein [Ruegeria atlantica]|uniref:hypothetical protein n=1 Tax=Ruegeria atlantica TaxID=81569 RepID=UPI002493D660|nr:hypothetical protein [Ruegeria atlantica]